MAIFARYVLCCDYFPLTPVRRKREPDSKVPELQARTTFRLFKAKIDVSDVRSPDRIRIECALQIPRHYRESIGIFVNQRANIPKFVHYLVTSPGGVHR